MDSGGSRHSPRNFLWLISVVFAIFTAQPLNWLLSWHLHWKRHLVSVTFRARRLRSTHHHSSRITSASQLSSPRRWTVSLELITKSKALPPRSPPPPADMVLLRLARVLVFWTQTAGLSTYRFAVPEMPLWSWNVYRWSGVFQSFLRFLASLAHQLCCTEFVSFLVNSISSRSMMDEGTLLLRRFLLVDLPGN